MGVLFTAYQIDGTLGGWKFKAIKAGVASGLDVSLGGAGWLTALAAFGYEVAPNHDWDLKSYLFYNRNGEAIDTKHRRVYEADN